MPIINVKFIETVVATQEQKHELIKRLTETFVSVLGEVVRPYTYVVIDETKVGDWGIAGKPMPDLGFLIGDEYAGYHRQANQIMGQAVAQQANQNGSTSQNGSKVNDTVSRDADARAERVWLGTR